MNLAAVLTTEPWMQRLGWVLIHFIWQGTAIALLLAVVLRFLAGRTSRSRYAACGLALLLCCIAPIMTWVVLSPVSTANVLATAPFRPATASAVEAPVRDDADFQPASGATSTDSIEEPWQKRLLNEIDAISPYLVALWLMGVLILATRLAWAWTLTRRLCRLGTPIRDEVLLQKWRNLLDRMAIRLPVRLLESAQMDVPTLIGWLRPTILLPATVLTGLTPDQLEAVLAHELAHVRRFDYLFNLLQSLVETILFYHPAVWWIGRRLREERENCCDDVSLDVVQNRHVYASALALLEEGRTTPLALTASGGSLLRRIQRIAGVDGHRASAAPLFIGLIILVALVVGLAWGPSLRAATTSSTSQSAQDKRDDQLYNDVRIEGLKVQNMPLDQFISLVSKKLAEQDPLKQGFHFVVNIPAGEPPIPITLDFARIPGYCANIGMILGAVKNQFPIRYKLDGPVVRIHQISQAEVAFTKRAAATLINIDFHSTDPVEALEFVQRASAAKGFAFKLDLKAIRHLDGVKKPAPINLQVKQVNVDQALRSIFYLANLHPTPLASFSGYRVDSQSSEATRAQTYLQIGSESFSTTKLDDKENFMEDVHRRSMWFGPSLNGPAFDKNGANLAMAGPVVMDMPEPDSPEKLHRLLSVKIAILDKSHLQIRAELEIKNGSGKSLGKVAGEEIVESGTRVWLTSDGKPALVLPAKGNSKPARGFVGLVQVTLMDEEGRPLLPHPAIGGKEIPVSILNVSNPSETKITKPGLIEAIKAANMTANRGTDFDLLDATKLGDFGEIDRLLRNGANPNASDGDELPLMYARDVKTVRLLVKHGANLRPKLDNGLTLLDMVVGRDTKDNSEIIEELIKDGTEFDPNGNGRGLLVEASRYNQINIVRQLLDLGVSPDAYADNHFLHQSALVAATLSTKPDILKLLLARGAHLAAARGFTSPLGAAIDGGRWENAAVLRQAGESDVGMLSEASARGDMQKADELIQAGADVNETDKGGETPLLFAVRRGNPDNARLLLQHGANINLFSNIGVTPYGEFMDLTERGYGGNTMPAWGIPSDEAARRIAEFKALFKQYPLDPNYRDASGQTALHRLAFEGDTVQMACLLEQKPDVNLRDDQGNTPLLRAAMSPIAHELDISQIDYEKDGKTISKQWNAEAVIADKLIKAGAQLDLKMPDGQTVGELAMAAAVKANNAQLISVLQAAGVKVPARDLSNPIETGKSDSARAVPPVSSSGKKPSDAVAPGAVQIELRLAEISDDDYQANRDKIDAAMKADGLKLLGLLNNMKGVDMICAPSVRCQPSKTVHIDIVRKFPYATTFDTDKDGKITPRDFTTADMGIKSAITATKENGKIQLNCALSLTDFDGFADSNIGVKVPTFHTVDTRMVEEVPATGEIRSIWIPGARADTETITDKDESGKTTVTRRNISKRLILFLSAKSSA